MSETEALPPSSLRNLGAAMDRWLREAGIETVAELRAIGAEAAWARLRFVCGPKVNLIGLYALEAALTDRDWRDLPPDRKAQLQAFARRHRREPAV